VQECPTLPDVRIRSFEPDDVEAAAGLLAQRHRRDRSAEALLSRRYEDPQVCAELIVSALNRETDGAVAVEGDRIVGYLLAIKGDDVLRGRHVWSGLVHHAVALDADPELVRHLYAHLATHWVDDARFHHYAVVPSADLAPWLALAFAHEQVHAVRETTGPVTSADPRRVAEPPLSLRRAEPADLDSVLPVARLIAGANVASPVFAYIDDAFYDDIRPGTLELLEDPGVYYWIAESAGEVVGLAAMRPIPADEGTLLKPPAAVELIVAATHPRLRGTGVGVALLERALAAAAAGGLDVCVTDWRAANLTASVFWPRRGFRPFAYRLHRLIDPRVQA
jgi:ribosomal protein S18 acetylase RimI-like enzyme